MCKRQTLNNTCIYLHKITLFRSENARKYNVSLVIPRASTMRMHAVTLPLSLYGPAREEKSDIIEFYYVLEAFIYLFKLHICTLIIDRQSVVIDIPLGAYYRDISVKHAIDNSPNRGS